MRYVRLIARLDVKNEYLVKGIHLEGLRKLGDPNEFAKKYYNQGIDELLYIDVVASLYERNSLLNIVKKTTEDIFIPITVGGGIRSIENVREVLLFGADKVAINTAAIKRPKLIFEVAQAFGSQCMVLSIQAKKISDNHWEAYYDNGREKTGLDVVDWAKKGYSLGAGEILLTSIDNEGTGKGYDVDLIRTVTEAVPVPVIACGGMGNIEHLEEVIIKGKADAVGLASILHYNRLNVEDIRKEALRKNIPIRGYENCHV